MVRTTCRKPSIDENRSGFHQCSLEHRSGGEIVRVDMMKPDIRHFKCKECGSTDLEWKMWVNQDMEITDDCEEHPYCNKCEEETRCE